MTNAAKAVIEIRECLEEQDLDPFDTACYRASARSLADTLILCNIAPEVDFSNECLARRNYLRNLNL